MDQQELRTLRILEEIEKDEPPSQRDLSRKLNISLGLVNSFFKRLAQKGYCKVSTIPKNRVRYLLTPKGAAEKTRLTYEYIQSSIHFYRNALHKVEQLFNALGHNGVRRIAFYGVSDLAEISYLLMQEASIQLVAIVDDKHRGRSFLKQTVVGSDQLADTSFDRILITDIIKPLKSYDEIKACGIPADRIVMI
ncbi:MAG: winged helix-turn-helix transcriptional regulator [Desulfobacteraceae bacterium]|jgi:DNA-binding MarR family transcriptional regulator